ncbi:Hypothetical predicted protein, partial [Marmota monax]
LYWVPLLYGWLTLYYVITVGCISFLYWKRKLENLGLQFEKVLRSTVFTHSPLLYWRNKKQQYGMKAAINTGSSPAGPQSDIQVEIPDSLCQLDTVKT